MKILIINGPNMNMLGIRQPEIYGNRTYKDLTECVGGFCRENGVEAVFFQSNHEGDIVDEIQNAYGVYDGLIINPAAYTHTSIAIADAVACVGIPAVEVHISDPDTREEFRKISYIRRYCLLTVKGEGFDGYIKAVKALLNK